MPIDLRKQEQKRPEYLKLNPDGKVPVLVDNDSSLRVLHHQRVPERKYPNPPLMPADLGKRAKARILTDYGLARLDGTISKAARRSDEGPEGTESASHRYGEKRSPKTLAALEDALGDQPYLVGDFSLADADLLPVSQD